MRSAKSTFTLIVLLLTGANFTRAQQPLFSVQGQQPALFVAPDGTLELVFGQGNLIYYAASVDEGRTFSPPVRVDSLPGLHLGASRGPRIAASRQAVVITAIDRLGNLYAYTLNRKSKDWSTRRLVNDVPEVAKEGFNALAGDGNGRFFVTWLDLRNDAKNKLYSATSSDHGKTWSQNRLVYRSPDSTVCECCQPTAVMQGQEVYVMFRNWLGGARDMYVARSIDGGTSFQEPVKQGAGTWKLNACPMDGGDLSVGNDGKYTSVWRRDNQLYYSGTEGGEKRLAEGRNASLAVNDGATHVVWHQGGEVWYLPPGQATPLKVGEGRFPRIVPLAGGRSFCVWEDAGTLRGKRLAEEK